VDLFFVAGPKFDQPAFTFVAAMSKSCTPSGDLAAKSADFCCDALGMLLSRPSSRVPWWCQRVSTLYLPLLAGFGRGLCSKKCSAET
jgi:hypothetical protein